MPIPSIFAPLARLLTPASPIPEWITPPDLEIHWTNAAMRRLRELSAAAPAEIERLVRSRRMVFLRRERNSNCVQWMLNDGAKNLVIVRDESTAAVIAVHEAGKTLLQRDPMTIAMAERIAGDSSPAAHDYRLPVRPGSAIGVRIRYQMPLGENGVWLRGRVSGRANSRPFAEVAVTGAGSRKQPLPHGARVHQILAVIESGGPVLFSAIYPLGVDDFPDRVSPR